MHQVTAVKVPLPHPMDVTAEAAANVNALAGIPGKPPSVTSTLFKLYRSSPSSTTKYLYSPPPPPHTHTPSPHFTGTHPKPQQPLHQSEGPLLLQNLSKKNVRDRSVIMQSEKRLYRPFCRPLLQHYRIWQKKRFWNKDKFYLMTILLIKLKFYLIKMYQHYIHTPISMLYIFWLKYKWQFYLIKMFSIKI